MASDPGVSFRSLWPKDWATLSAAMTGRLRIYHRRLRIAAGQFDTNPAVSEALDRLLSASAQWLATNVAERYKAERQVLELVEHVVELL